MTNVEDQPDGIDYSKEGDDSINDPDDLKKVNEEDVEDVEDHGDDDDE